MINLTQHTISLIGNIRNLDANLEELISRFKTMTNSLEETENTLLISKQLYDKLDELYIYLGVTDTALSDLSNLPYVAPLAKVSAKAVTQIMEIVIRAKTRAGDLETKIKAHREKLKKFRDYIDKTVKTLNTVEEFIKKEGQLVDATHKMNTKLPESRYKNLSQERLNNSSELQIELLIVPNKVVDKANELLPKINSIISEIEKLCETAEKVFEPIHDILNEMNRIVGITKDINKALQKVLSINFVGGKTVLIIKNILTATGIIPSINSLTISAVEILEPLLKNLGVKFDKITGLDLSLENLEKVFYKLNRIEKLKNKIKSVIAIFINDHNPQKTFEQLEKGD